MAGFLISLESSTLSLVQQRAGFDSVALLEGHFAQGTEYYGNTLLVPHLPTDCKTLLEQSEHFGRIALGEKDRICQSTERKGDTLAVPQRSKERQALLSERNGSGILPLLTDHPPQVDERPGDTFLVPRLSEERQALLCQ